MLRLRRAATSVLAGPLVARRRHRSTVPSRSTVTVNVLSDPRCPWCYITHHRLQAAIAACADTVDVRVRFKPFFLDDELPVAGVDRQEYYRQRFGDEAMHAVTAQMTALFRSERMSHEYESNGTASSSLRAHRLLAFAERRFSNDQEVAERVAGELFRRYFSSAAENISDLNVLESVAIAAGITDVAETRAFLAGDALTDAVVTSAAGARRLGMSVPHLAISNTNGAVETISGTAETQDICDRLARAAAGGAAAAPPLPAFEPDSSGPATDGLQATRRDVLAGIRMRWRSENLLPRMLALQDWPSDPPFMPEHFRRLDESSDAGFYEEPRLEHHLDAASRRRLEDHLAECWQLALDAQGREQQQPPPAVLDLCSSWTSHHPAEMQADAVRVHGVGMNEKELEHNPGLTDFVVKDLNLRPDLGHLRSDTFDMATCSLSVDYLTSPLVLLGETLRVLRPGGRAVVAFSNRMFRSKVVEIWRDADDATRLWIVAAYFRYATTPESSTSARGGSRLPGAAPRWKGITVLDFSDAAAGGDPLFVVQATKGAVGDM